MAQILLKEGIAQPTPPSDTLAIYAKTDNKLYIKNPSGVETLISGSEASGTVTTVSVNSANGFTGTVTNPTTTPAITVATNVTGIIKGNGTSISAATSGTDYAPATSGTSILSGNSSGGFSNVTIGANLTFSGGTLSATGGGASTWGSITGTLSNQTDLVAALADASSGIIWNTVNVVSQVASAGQGYAIITNAATEIILNATPTTGDLVSVKVCNGLLTNSINPNGKTIEGVAENIILDNAIANVTLRYFGDTLQWRLI